MVNIKVEKHDNDTADVTSEVMGVAGEVKKELLMAINREVKLIANINGVDYENALDCIYVTLLTHNKE